jgi:hypothetical protein
MMGKAIGKYTPPNYEPKVEREPVDQDASRIMYNALVRIAHSEAFFDREKQMVRIAQEAIEKVTGVKR